MSVAPAHRLSPRRLPQVALLQDGRRLHLQDGPIDLVIEAVGPQEAVTRAYRTAAQRFIGLLDRLCLELAVLREAADPSACRLQGIVARRMWAAVAPFADQQFITPMAAVAGAVAEEVLGALKIAGISRAYVNNGGDIALYLAPGEAFTVGLVDRPDQPRIIGTAVISAESGMRGVATSGWRGRSFSLGIADAVTILAPTAAMADAAATIIANAVDLPEHAGIVRVPAQDLQEDTDLGARPVTQSVPDLSREDCDRALARGLACAERLMARSLIAGAALHLQGHTVGTGALAAPLPGPDAGRAAGVLQLSLDLSSQPEQEHAHA